MQMDIQQKLQRSDKPKDACDKVVDIYEATKKQLLEASRSYPFEQNQEKFQVEAKIRCQAIFKQYGWLGRKDKGNETTLLNKQSSFQSKQAHEDQICYMKMLKEQYNKKKLKLPSLKDSVFLYDSFMKQHKINFAKTRRLQKQISNLVLLNSFQFKAMPLPQQLEQEGYQLKEELNKFYEEEREKVKMYFPENYQHIFALSTATGRMTDKERKKKNDQ